jgi:hypothetical protein
MKKLILPLLLVLLFASAGWGGEKTFAIVYDSETIAVHKGEINSLDLLIAGAFSDTAGVNVPIYLYACPMSMTIFQELNQPFAGKDEWIARDLVTGKKVIHRHGWYLLDFRNQEAKRAVQAAIGNILRTKNPAGMFLDHGEFRIYEGNFRVEGEPGLAPLIDPEIMGTWRTYFTDVINLIKWFRKQVIINPDAGGYFQFRNIINGVYIEGYGEDQSEYQHRNLLEQDRVIEEALSDNKTVLIDPLNRVEFK